VKQTVLQKKKLAQNAHVIKNLIPNGVANIQYRLQALNQSFYVCFFSQEFSCAHQGEANIN
jgi:hypothetical protein